MDKTSFDEAGSDQSPVTIGSSEGLDRTDLIPISWGQLQDFYQSISRKVEHNLSKYAQNRKFDDWFEETIREVSRVLEEWWASQISLESQAAILCSRHELDLLCATLANATYAPEGISPGNIGAMRSIQRKNLEFYTPANIKSHFEELSSTPVCNVEQDGFHIMPYDVGCWHGFNRIGGKVPPSYFYSLYMTIRGDLSDDERSYVQGKCRTGSMLYDKTAVYYLLRKVFKGNKDVLVVDNATLRKEDLDKKSGEKASNPDLAKLDSLFNVSPKTEVELVSLIAQIRDFEASQKLSQVPVSAAKRLLAHKDRLCLCVKRLADVRKNLSGCFSYEYNRKIDYLNCLERFENIFNNRSYVFLPAEEKIKAENRAQKIRAILASLDTKEKTLDLIVSMTITDEKSAKEALAVIDDFLCYRHFDKLSAKVRRKAERFHTKVITWIDRRNRIVAKLEAFLHKKKIDRVADRNRFKLKNQILKSRDYDLLTGSEKKLLDQVILILEIRHYWRESAIREAYGALEENLHPADQKSLLISVLNSDYEYLLPVELRKKCQKQLRLLDPKSVPKRVKKQRSQPRKRKVTTTKLNPKSKALVSNAESNFSPVSGSEFFSQYNCPNARNFLLRARRILSCLDSMNALSQKLILQKIEKQAQSYGLTLSDIQSC